MVPPSAVFVSHCGEIQSLQNHINSHTGGFLRRNELFEVTALDSNQAPPKPSLCVFKAPEVDVVLLCEPAVLQLIVLVQTVTLLPHARLWVWCSCWVR